MRSSLRFLDIAKTGVNSLAKFVKTLLLTLLWIFPAALIMVLVGILNGQGIESENRMASIQPPTLALGLSLLAFLFALYGLTRQVRLQHKRHWKTIITPNASINWTKMAIGAVVWGCLILVDMGFGYTLEPERFTWVFQPVEWLLTFIVVIIMVPFQAAFEELACRGYLMQASALVSRRVWQPILFSSLSFGAWHLANPEIKADGWVMMIYYIGIGLVFGIATLMDDSVEIAIGAHAINNILVSLLVTHPNSALQTPALFRFERTQPSAFWLVIDTVVPGVIFLAILAKVYGWGSWKRLFAPIWDLREPENAENTTTINPEPVSE
jgi:membrane protease YdiL (CAAX protease family)